MVYESLRQLIVLAFKEELNYELTLQDFWNDEPIEQWLTYPYYSAYFDVYLEEWFKNKGYKITVTDKTTCFDIYNQLNN